MDGITVNPITQSDIGEAVRSTALLADVAISVWGAERTDQKLLAQIKEDAGAVGNVGRVVKNMLAGADEPLKLTRSAFNAVRTEHYALTLPWVANPHAERQRGPRLLPTILFDKYLTTLSTRRREALAALDRFIDQYPDLVVRAQSNLGTLADISYPTAEEVRAQFHVSFDFTPIPDSAQFRGLPDQVLYKLGKTLETRQTRMVETATAAMWSEVRERLERVVERMADPAAKFHASTVENARELVELLPGWNVTGTLQAQEIAEDISRMLAGVDAKKLRDDAHTRADVAHQARTVVEKLRDWGV